MHLISVRFYEMGDKKILKITQIKVEDKEKGSQYTQ